MHHRPSLLRLAAALIFSLGLWGGLIAPADAQDATPEADVTPVEEPSAADVGDGTLLLLYYLCDGDVGFEFTVGNPSEGNPNPLVDDCTPSSAVDGTDATFLIYEFGDTNAVPQEITTVDGVIQVELPPTDSTPHKITQKLPGESIEEPIEADFEIVADTFTGVNATQFQVGSVEVHKFRCTGNPDESTFNFLNPGDELDPAPYEACSVDDRDFTITPFDNVDEFGTVALSTVDGVATAGDIPTTSIASGAHKITEDGTELLGLFDVEAGLTTIIVAVNYVDATGSLEIDKLECVGNDDTRFYINEDAPQTGDPDCGPASVDFSIYLFGDLGSDPIAVTTDGGGFGEALNLPVTDDTDPHLLIEDATFSEVTFNVEADVATQIDVVNFTPPPAQDGAAEIEKFDCAGVAEPTINAGNPGDDSINIPSWCSAGSAGFYIHLFGDEGTDPIAVTVNGLESVELPETGGVPHLLIEVNGSGEVLTTAYFEVEGGTVTPIQVLNPTYGSIIIYSYVCEGNQGAKFDVFEPNASGTLPTDCDPLNRSFVIELFSGAEFSTANTITNSGGTASTLQLNGILATGDLAHLISTASGSISASFKVNEGELTVIVYKTYQPANTGDDTDDSENVENLPDTGTGPAAADPGGSTLLFGLLSIGAMVGLAAFSRRRSLQ